TGPAGRTATPADAGYGSRTAHHGLRVQAKLRAHLRRRGAGRYVSSRSPGPLGADVMAHGRSGLAPRALGLAAASARCANAISSYLCTASRIAARPLSDNPAPWLRRG